MDQAKDVDAFIESAPNEARPRLRQMRTAIKEAAPGAVESISYGMPFYSFSEESGFGARLCYFGLQKGKGKVAFYTRPAYLAEYKREVEPYMTAKSALQFPLDRPIPIDLVKKIVRNGIRKHRATRQ